MEKLKLQNIFAENGFKYKILKKLGKDGTGLGVQYLGKEPITKARYLIIKREAKAAASELAYWKDCRHSQVLTFLYFFQHGKYVYTVYPYLAEGNLKQFVSKHSDRLTLGLLKRWAMQLFMTLKYFHDKGFAHLNINPSDLYLDEELTLFVSGLAHVTPLNFSDATMGCKDFRPPECCKEVVGDGKSTDLTKIDVWSAGACLYYVTTRKFLKPVGTNPQKIRMKLDKLYKFPDQKFVRFLECLLAHNPELRPSAKEALEYPYIELRFYDNSAESTTRSGGDVKWSEEKISDSESAHDRLEKYNFLYKHLGVDLGPHIDEWSAEESGDDSVSGREMAFRSIKSQDDLINRPSTSSSSQKTFVSSSQKTLKCSSQKTLVSSTVTITRNINTPEITSATSTHCTSPVLQTPRVGIVSASSSFDSDVQLKIPEPVEPPTLVQVKIFDPNQPAKSNTDCSIISERMHELAEIVANFKGKILCPPSLDSSSTSTEGVRSEESIPTVRCDRVKSPPETKTKDTIWINFEEYHDIPTTGKPPMKQREASVIALEKKGAVFKNFKKAKSTAQPETQRFRVLSPIEAEAVEMFPSTSNKDRELDLSGGVTCVVTDKLYDKVGAILEPVKGGLSYCSKDVLGAKGYEKLGEEIIRVEDLAPCCREALCGSDTYEKLGGLHPTEFVRVTELLPRLQFNESQDDFTSYKADESMSALPSGLVTARSGGISSVYTALGAAPGDLDYEKYLDRSLSLTELKYDDDEAKRTRKIVERNKSQTIMELKQIFEKKAARPPTATEHVRVSPTKNVERKDRKDQCRIPVYQNKLSTSPDSKFMNSAMYNLCNKNVIEKGKKRRESLRSSGPTF